MSEKESQAMSEALDTIHDVAVKALTGTQQEMHDALERILSVARYKSDVLAKER